MIPMGPLCGAGWGPRLCCFDSAAQFLYVGDLNTFGLDT
jgi:hypothetical protein